MAGFGWSMRHGNNDMRELNHAGKSHFATTQIACRICDQVFLSTQALINHIETHMMDNETAAVSRRQQELNLMLSQRDLLTNPFQQNFSLLTQPMRPTIQNSSGCVSQVLQERNPFYGATPRFVSPMAARPFRLSSLGREHLVFGPQHMLPKSRQQGKAQRRVMAVASPRDCTKPFLDQLQQIPEVHMVKEVEMEDGNNRMHDSETLDLTLKL